MPISRRNLITAGTAAMTAASYSRILGANDTVRLGVIGCGGRGRGVSGIFAKNPDVRIVALCDVWGQRVAQAAANLHAEAAAKFTDHRRLLDEDQTDAVYIATPDHWHCLIAIDALNAGKDVYCEKPLSLTVDEGPQVVKAARINNRICQVGMQQRSIPHYLKAKAD